jgi:hypothetical protein
MEQILPTTEATFKAELGIDHLVRARISQEEARLDYEIKQLTEKLPALRQAVERTAEALKAVLAKAQPHPAVVKLAEIAREVQFDDHDRKAFLVLASAQLVDGMAEVTTTLELGGYSRLTKTVRRGLLAHERKIALTHTVAIRARMKAENEVLRLQRELQEWSSPKKQRAIEGACTMELLRNSTQLKGLVGVAGCKLLK